MTSREELIEKAAKAIEEAAQVEFDGIEIGERAQRTIRVYAEAAFAVFEEQQEPSEDEREALARALFIASDDFAYAERMAKAWDAPGPHGRARWYNYADAILAAGFRRPVSPEPSECPQPCIHLSQEDAREGRTCSEHPCTCPASPLEGQDMNQTTNHEGDT